VSTLENFCILGSIAFLSALIFLTIAGIVGEIIQRSKENK